MMHILWCMHIWRSKDKSVDSLLTFHLYLGCQPGVASAFPHLLSHLDALFSLCAVSVKIRLKKYCVFVYRFVLVGMQVGTQVPL